MRLANDHSLVLTTLTFFQCYDTNLSLHFLQLLDSHEHWSVIDRMTAIQKDSHWKPVDLKSNKTDHSYTILERAQKGELECHLIKALNIFLLSEILTH